MERIIVILVTSLVLASHTDGRFPFQGGKLGRKARDEADGRLPLDLSPYHYNLQIGPDITGPAPPFPFYGQVDIYFDCLTATNVITINYDGIYVTDGTIVISVSPDSPGNPPAPVFVSWDTNFDAQFLYFYVEDELVEGEKYIISMQFNGALRNDAYGLYYDSYIGTTGFTTYLAATQLEAHGGRMMFPGFDEPQFKSTFNVTVLRFPTDTTVANMPLLSSETRPGGWVADIYDQSPRMALYLVCICSGDFQRIPAGNINGYDVGVWSRPQMIDQMNFAVESAAPIQAWLDQETGITFPLPKSDHIALPNKGGAMENWGLVTYGETNFAVNPETSAASGIQLAGLIIAHELAHMWYGDLVTCKWWDDIWLNEGFATFYEFRPTQAIGWEGSEASQMDTQDYMVADARNNSDPVRKVILSPWDADLSFSGSTYPKGGAMVYMLQGILTQGTFNAGLTRYLQTFSYQPATTDDLWQVLTEQAADDGILNPDGSALDVKEKMDPWLNQMGYPLITVTRNADGTATASRSHFQRPANQIMNTESPWNYVWDVPITVVTAESDASDWEAGPVAWIDIDETETTISGLPTDLSQWIIVNPRQNMYYRVLYDDDNLAAIVNQLNTDPFVIDVESRAQLIDDTFSIARAGHIAETSAMDATLYLVQETKYSPWYAAIKHLRASFQWVLWGQQEIWGILIMQYLMGRAVPIYHNLGWEYSDSETPLEQFLRRDLISIVCSAGDMDCITTAIDQYALIIPDPSANVVDPNNLATVLCIGVSLGDESDYRMSFNQYTERISSQIREERYSYLYGCSCTTDTTLLDEFLVEIGTNIANRDRNTATRYLSESTYGAEILWDYLDANWNSLPASLNGMTAIGNMAATFSTTDGLDKLNTFISNHPPTSTGQINSFTQMVLNVQSNIDWYAANADSLQDWLWTNQPDKVRTKFIMKNGQAYRMPVSPLTHWAEVSQSYKADLHQNHHL